MRHSVQELVATAHEYFPRGIPSVDPRYGQSPEVLRQKAVRVPVSAQYVRWRAMLDGLRLRFPEAQFPGVHVENACYFLQVATATNHDRCFTGQIWLPARSPLETHHKLEFLVSFVVPYYVLQSSHFEDDLETPEVPAAKRGRIVIEGDTMYVFPPDPNAVDDEPKETKPRRKEVRSFTLSPDEEPFARAIAEEIEVTFPRCEPIPPEVGLTVVPGVEAGSRSFGEATIFTCLFSDNW